MIDRDFAEEVQRGNAGLLRWQTSRDEEGVVVAFAGEIDVSNASVLGSVLAELLNSDSDVIVDLAEVSFLDSSAISRLVSAAKNAAAVGCRLTVRRPTRTVLRVLQLTGVDDALLRPVVRPSGGSLAS
jgi:anti-anti-sigma factor